MPRNFHRTLAASAVALCGIAASSFAATPPVATAARDCAPPRYPGDGYFTSLKTSGVSCATGKKVALRHYRCRTHHSIKGRCNERVMGFACTEKRATIPTEINARVTCRQAGKTVVFTYQQNT